MDPVDAIIQQPGIEDNKMCTNQTEDHTQLVSKEDAELTNEGHIGDKNELSREEIEYEKDEKKQKRSRREGIVDDETSHKRNRQEVENEDFESEEDKEEESEAGSREDILDKYDSEGEEADSDEDMEEGSEAESGEYVERETDYLSIHRYVEGILSHPPGVGPPAWYKLEISDHRWWQPGVQVHPLIPSLTIPQWSCWPGSLQTLSFAKERLHECLDSHELCNRSASDILPKRILSIGKSHDDPIYLIETQSQGGDAQRGRYAALSYCWGDTSFIKTLHSNIEAHKDSIFPSSLPVVFREAISLCHRFEIPFIWIDSLCIIQNSKEDWLEESAKMIDYYSNAFLTISATSSPNPSVPFLGMRRDDKFATHFFDVYNAPDEERKIVYARLSHLSTPNRKRADVEHYGPLNNRAWAWQESALSSRNLHFCRSQLWWECRTHFVPETMVDGVESRFGQARTLNLARDDPFSCWTKAITEFNQRSLTVKPDLLVAISGAAARIQSLIGGKYYAGIWEAFLIPGLCWRLGISSLVDIQKELQGTGSEYIAPSWSWASLRGELRHLVMPGDAEFACLMKIEEISTVLEANSNPLGQVKSGCLRVTGLVVEYQLAWGTSGGLGAGLDGPHFSSLFSWDCYFVQDESLSYPCVRRGRSLAVDKMVAFRRKAPLLIMGHSGSRFYLMVLGSNFRRDGSYSRLGIWDTNSSLEKFLDDGAIEKTIDIF